MTEAGGPQERAVRGRRAPTIIDVARRAGVSKSLVSLVLRGEGPPLVSEKRRNVVLQAVEELGYRPNSVARGLVQQRTGLIGVLVSDLRNPFFSELAESLDTEARNHGLRAVLAAGLRDEEREQMVVDDFLNSRVDAIILLSPMLPAAAISRAADAVPIVVEGRPNLRSTRVDLVGTDDAMGAEIAVEHLVGLGHERISHLAGVTAAARRRGYERAMGLRHLDSAIEVIDCNETDEGAYRAAMRLLDRREPPSAIFAVNDVAAMGVLAAAAELGISVPQQLSVVGFDDTDLARLPQIGLTTVAQPITEMAAAIISALGRRLESNSGRLRTLRRRLPPRLVVRDSTAGIASGYRAITRP
jgi:DNA-binding LacI/PurR family transcriptional regulator